jgi:copper(I)-binding protein
MKAGRCGLAAGAGLMLALAVAPASARIVLSQPTFEAGQNYAAFFKLDSGCEGSPTTALRVEIPAGVVVLQTPEKPGWAVNAEQAAGRVSAVTWRGRLDAKSPDQFGLFLKLPADAGTLYFPAVQRCEKGQIAWTAVPLTGQAGANVGNPAPALRLTAAQSPAALSHYMAGSIMIEQPWSPATPGGATTAAAYMTIMNHGSMPDTLLGGSMASGGKLEIHQMSMAGGIMSMRPVTEGVTIPAGGTVVLSPQGPYHAMLLGLKSSLVQGTRVPATLTFAKAGQVRIELAVAPIGARAFTPAGAMSGMDHH